MKIFVKYYNFLVIIFLITITLSSCKKDKVPELIDEVESISNECDGCQPLPDGNFGVFDQYLTDSIYYTSAQFNPNNDNEIVYMKWELGGQTIYKYNLITQQNTFVFNGQFSGCKISWGADDWILLPLMDFQIWKIKSDGTQLAQVTSNGAWFHPEWNIAGDRFIAFHGYVDVNDFHKGKVWSTNGVVIDSFNWSPTISDWNNPLGLGCVNNGKISVIEPYTGEYISYLETEPIDYSGFNWISGTEALITSKKGIYRYNINTYSLTKIKCSCSSMFYLGGTVNSSNSKIIFSRAELTRLDGSTVLDRSRLVMMNIDGTEEVKIEIP